MSLIVYAATFLLALLLIYFLMRNAEKLGIMDMPNERSTHKKPVPRGAGHPAQLILENSKIKNAMQWKARYDDIALICKTAFAWEQKFNTFSNEA